MGKFCGAVGFIVPTQVSLGKWQKVTTERTYYGDTERRSYRVESNDTVIDTPTLNYDISIVSDDFAYTNCGYIKYVVISGSKWRVTSVNPSYPRLKLSLGGLYNENERSTSSNA